MLFKYGVFFIAISLRASLATRCICPKYVDPVCGSNGETYSNICMLECSQAGDPNLALTSEGPCQSKSESQTSIEEESADKEYTPEDFNSLEMTDCECSQEVEPVCGSDGVTYDNSCLLKCAKNSIASLELLKGGPCDVDESDIRARSASCSCLFDMRSQDELTLIECLMGPGGCLRRKPNKPHKPHKPNRPNEPYRSRFCYNC